MVTDEEALAMEEEYKERNKIISEVKLEEKFKNRIKLVRKVSVKHPEYKYKIKITKN